MSLYDFTFTLVTDFLRMEFNFEYSCRCLDHPYMPNNPRGRFYPAKRDIRDLMSDFHSEETLRDKPDCGVIDPAWCKGQGQNYPIPCKKMIITLYNKDLWIKDL